MKKKYQVVSDWASQKLFKYLVAFLLATTSIQSNAAWLVSDLTVIDLLTTMQLADKAAQADQVATNKIITANLAAVPIPSVPATLTISDDTSIAATLRARAVVMATHRAGQCIRIVLGTTVHPSDLVINVACAAMTALRVEMIAAHTAFVAQMGGFSIAADSAVPIASPLLTAATVQSLALQKIQFAVSTNTSLYMAYVQAAQLELEEYKSMIRDANTKKIYGQ